MSELFPTRELFPSRTNEFILRKTVESLRVEAGKELVDSIKTYFASFHFSPRERHEHELHRNPSQEITQAFESAAFLREHQLQSIVIVVNKLRASGIRGKDLTDVLKSAIIKVFNKNGALRGTSLEENAFWDYYGNEIIIAILSRIEEQAQQLPDVSTNSEKEIRTYVQEKVDKARAASRRTAESLMNQLNQ